MKLKKLSEEHYIIMDDSEIKEGDLYLCWESKSGISTDYTIDNTFSHWIVGADNYKKITHSTQPLDCACSNRGYKLNTNCAERNRCFDKVQYLPLQEVKELLGIVYVEKKANKQWGNVHRTGVLGYIEGYNQCLEDNKEKKYTDEDMLTIRNQLVAFLLIGDVSALTKWFDEYVESLQSPTEWEVEFVNGKLKLKS